MEIQKIGQLSIRPRGPYCQRFRKQSIISNHYEVTVGKINKIVIFRIKFTPSILADNKLLRSELLSNVWTDINQIIPGAVSSGFSIYSINEPLSQKIELMTTTKDGNSYSIIIQLVKTLNLAENPKLLLGFLNNALRNTMNKLDYVEIGRTSKYFNIKKKQAVESLILFSGYQSSFVNLERSIYLRVDTAKKVVRQETVLQFINSLYKLHHDKEKEEKRSIISQELVGKIVMTNYGKLRYHRVEDIDYTELCEILLDDQTPIIEYYHSKYGIEVVSKKQPLLVTFGKKGTEKILLLSELCLMTGIPESFDEFRRKKISELTIKNPAHRKQEIHGLINELLTSNQLDHLDELGIKISKDMANITARTIPTPTIALGDKRRIEQGRQSFFNLYDKPIYASKHQINLAILYFSGVDVKGVIQLFNNTSKNLKVDLQCKKYDCGESYSRQAVQVIQKRLQTLTHDGYNVCMIILPHNLRSQYKKVKQFALLEKKILSQIVIQSTLKKKGFQSICTKVLLQIIAKRGNTLWFARGPSEKEGIMLIGINLAKFGSGTLVVSVGTLNSTLTTISSRAKLASSSDQLIFTIRTQILSLVQAYTVRNKKAPKEILVVQNSSSQTQIQILQTFLIDPIIEMMDQTYRLSVPALSYIICNVRTNERFFSMGGEARNVSAGTIVASDVVSSTQYDFYLVSQSSNRGTVVPNHYRVIFNNSKMEEGQLQEILYYQCFNYVNWTGSIKIPSVLQYAKKCSKFHQEILSNQSVPQELENKLYYI